MIYKTKGTCSREIHLEVENDIITELKFIGGCSGNSTGISKLVVGMNIHDVIKKVEGINCNGRGTSCPDQLAKALKTFL